jgi:hypothetical protein
MEHRYASMWVSAVGEDGSTLEDLEQGIEEWNSQGWYVVGYSTDRTEDGSMLHNVIWRRD